MDGSTILTATYIGGSGGDSISAIAVDRNGNIYIAGGTSSIDFPVTADAYQRTPGPYFLSILSANGRQLLHSTYLAFSTITAIAVDAQGRVLVAGSATRGAFPESFPSTSDAAATHPFVAAFSSQLSALSYGTAIDASPTGAVNAISVLAMTMDSPGNVFVTGSTNGSPSIFVTKLNSSGVKVWSFAFGGSLSDSPYSLSVDSAGQVHVVGVTVSPDFPVTPGAFRAPSNDALALFIQGFAAKLSVDGSHSISYTCGYHPHGYTNDLCRAGHCLRALRHSAGEGRNYDVKGSSDIMAAVLRAGIPERVHRFPAVASIVFLVMIRLRAPTPRNSGRGAPAGVSSKQGTGLRYIHPIPVYSA